MDNQGASDEVLNDIINQANRMLYPDPLGRGIRGVSRLDILARVIGDEGIGRLTASAIVQENGRFAWTEESQSRFDKAFADAIRANRLAFTMATRAALSDEAAHVGVDISTVISRLP